LTEIIPPLETETNYLAIELMEPVEPVEPFKIPQIKTYKRNQPEIKNFLKTLNSHF
jgi:hypothetical protein